MPKSDSFLVALRPKTFETVPKSLIILVTLKAPSLFSRRAGVVVWQAGLAQLKKHSSKNVLIL